MLLTRSQNQRGIFVASVYKLTGTENVIPELTGNALGSLPEYPLAALSVKHADNIAVFSCACPYVKRIVGSAVALDYISVGSVAAEESERRRRTERVVPLAKIVIVKLHIETDSGSSGFGVSLLIKVVLFLWNGENYAGAVRNHSRPDRHAGL